MSYVIIHVFKQYLNTFCIHGAVLDTGCKMMNNTNKVCFHSAKV